MCVLAKLTLYLSDFFINDQCEMSVWILKYLLKISLHLTFKTVCTDLRVESLNPQAPQDHSLDEIEKPWSGSIAINFVKTTKEGFFLSYQELAKIHPSGIDNLQDHFEDLYQVPDWSKLSKKSRMNRIRIKSNIRVGCGRLRYKYNQIIIYYLSRTD